MGNMMRALFQEKVPAKGVTVTFTDI